MNKIEAELIKELVPDFDKRLEMFKAKPEDLIGKIVKTITGGFSSSSGGRLIKIESMDKVQFFCSDPTDVENSTKPKWCISIKNKHNKIQFI